MSTKKSNITLEKLFFIALANREMPMKIFAEINGVSQPMITRLLKGHSKSRRLTNKVIRFIETELRHLKIENAQVLIENIKAAQAAQAFPKQIPHLSQLIQQEN